MKLFFSCQRRCDKSKVLNHLKYNLLQYLQLLLIFDEGLVVDRVLAIASISEKATYMSIHFCIILYLLFLNGKSYVLNPPITRLSIYERRSTTNKHRVRCFVDRIEVSIIKIKILPRICK